MTDKIDKTLEEFLDGRSSVSRGYAELGDEQPPAALDRSILAAATSAVAREEDATVIRVRDWRKWSVPVALAATVVVAVPLVVRTIDLGIDEQPSVPQRQVVVSKSDGDASFEFLTPETLVEEPQPAAVTAPQSSAPAAPAAPAAPPAQAAPVAPPATAAHPPPAEKRRDRGAYGLDAPSAPADLVAMSDSRERPQTDRSGDDTPGTAVLSRSTDALAEVRLEQGFEEQTRDAASMRPKDTLREDDLGLAAYRHVYPDQHGFAERIARLYRNGQTRAARLEFGEFLILYPEAELPDDFPLERSEAIQPQRRIIREADEWLRSVAMLAESGRIDAARQELARFFERYPDYELPGWFPLNRDDAAPIER